MELGQLEGECGHVKAGARIAGMVPDLKKVSSSIPRLRVITGKIFAHKIEGENIIPGRNRCVGGKNGGPLHLIHGISKDSRLLQRVPGSAPAARNTGALR